MMFTQNDKNSTGANKKPSIVCYIAYLVLFFTLKKNNEVNDLVAIEYFS